MFIYSLSIDETLVYNEWEESFDSNIDILPFVSFNYEVSNFGIPIIYNYSRNDCWQANIVSIPMEFIDLRDSRAVEQTILKQLNEMYNQIPFEFAYCLHEHEIEIDELTENYIEELLGLHPSLYFLPNGINLEMKLGTTLLDGMTAR